MLEKMKELIADQLSVDADSITEASSFKGRFRSRLPGSVRAGYGFRG